MGTSCRSGEGTLPPSPATVLAMHDIDQVASETFFYRGAGIGLKGEMYFIINFDECYFLQTRTKSGKYSYVSLFNSLIFLSVTSFPWTPWKPKWWMVNYMPGKKLLAS